MDKEVYLIVAQGSAVGAFEGFDSLPPFYSISYYTLSSFMKSV